MKTRNRFTVQLALALVVVVTALNGPGPKGLGAVAEGQEQDSRERASSKRPRSTNLGAPDDDVEDDETGEEKHGDQEAEEAAPTQAPETNGEPHAPTDDDWLNNMRDVPEQAKRAIALFEQAGVRVPLLQHQENLEEDGEDDDGAHDDAQDDDAQDNGEGPEEGEQEARSAGAIRVTFRMSGAEADHPGFNAEFSRKALGQLLRSLPNVYEIDLRGTNIGDAQLNALGDVDALAKTLTILNLDTTHISDGALAPLADLTEMDTMYLSATQIGDEGLAHLRRMKKLRSLVLDGTIITDVGLKELGRMRSLRGLGIAHTGISDAGLRHLRSLPLEGLSLIGTGVTDAGLVHFREGMTDLQQLALVDTKVTKEGVDQLRRDVPRLQDQESGGATHLRILCGSTLAGNPAAIEPATPAQVARLKEALWWLPAVSETLAVAHGPFAFARTKFDAAWDLDNTTTRFHSSALSGGYYLDASRLNQVPVALLLNVGRFRSTPLDPRVRATLEQSEIVVFERPLGDAGESFMAAATERATKTELIGQTMVAHIGIDFGSGKADSTIFIARAGEDVLLSADNRDYLAEVLGRMAKKGDQRAFPGDLPEWKHLDLSARQWAMRHYKDADSAFAGLVYSQQAGDVAKFVLLSRDDEGQEFGKRVFQSWALEVRERDANLIEITYAVRTKQDLTDFFGNVFYWLWTADPEAHFEKWR